MGYIEQYLEYTKSYESPTDFFYWAALAGIGATLRSNCYLLLGDTRIYPNLYILNITAKPAMRKAKPLNSTIELMKAVDNTKIIEGRTSIQAVIQRLSEVERRNGQTVEGAAGIIFSEEISAMFTEDDANIPVLTDIYDYHSSYSYTLVSRPTAKLKNVVISLLGASNEELLRPVFNNRAIYGGLLSRCLIVYGDRVRHRNSLVYEDPKDYSSQQAALVILLRKFSQLQGIIQLDDAAKKHYDNWYHEVCPKLESNAGLTGAEGRIHTNILKVATNLAVSRTTKLVIEEEDVKLAIEKCQSLFVNYRRLTRGSGKSRTAEETVIVMDLLWRAPGYTLTRQQIMYAAWSDINDTVMEEVSKTLEATGIVQITEHRGDNSQSIYRLTALAVRTFKEEKV